MLEDGPRNGNENDKQEKEKRTESAANIPNISLEFPLARSNRGLISSMVEASPKPLSSCQHNILCAHSQYNNNNYHMGSHNDNKNSNDNNSNNKENNENKEKRNEKKSKRKDKNNNENDNSKANSAAPTIPVCIS